MASLLDTPSEGNGFLMLHAQRLLQSLRHWTGRQLVDADAAPADQARALFHAPYIVLSHDTAADPILNYANQAALRLFELSWHELIRLPSRLTAEPLHRAERSRLLATVTEQGFIDDYRGVRISKSGRRFMIEQATVWNLVDKNGAPYGQAATFSRWAYIS
jgi:PAS domain-containing protein